MKCKACEESGAPVVYANKKKSILDKIKGIFAKKTVPENAEERVVPGEPLVLLGQQVVSGSGLTVGRGIPPVKGTTELPAHPAVFGYRAPPMFRRRAIPRPRAVALRRRPLRVGARQCPYPCRRDAKGSCRLICEMKITPTIGSVIPIPCGAWGASCPPGFKPAR